MTISIVGTPVFSSTAASTTLTISLPSNSAGDYILLLVGNGEDSPQPSITTAPNGYTALGSLGFYDYGPGGLNTHCYYKVSSGSETSTSITWSTGDSNGGGLWALAVIVRTTGTWDSTDPVTLLSGTYNSTASSSPAPDQFSLSNLGHAVHFLQTSDNNNSTLGTANGWTLRGGGNTTSGSDGSIHVADQTFTTTGTKSHPVWSLDLGPDVFSWRTVLFREVSNDKAGTASVTNPVPVVTGSGKKAGSGTASATHVASITPTVKKAVGGSAGTLSVAATLSTTPAKGARGSAGTLSTGTSVTATGAKGGQASVTATLTATLESTGYSVMPEPHYGTATITETTALTAEGVRSFYAKRYPNVILYSSHLSGAYTDVDEDPNNPDGSWLLFAA